MVPVSIPSDRGIRSGCHFCIFFDVGSVVSQSPLIGAFVPGNDEVYLINHISPSQSPLIGAFVPGKELLEL